MNRFAAACVLLTLATSAPAQKGKPTTPLTPEIAYTYASGNYMDLRLANEDGTGAVTLHRGAYGAITQFDLGPRSQMQVAFLENRDLKLLTYEPTGTGNVRTSGVVTLYAGPGNVDSLSFSLDGSKIAIFVQEQDNNRILALDTANGAVTELGKVNWAFYLAWYHDGSGVVYKDLDQATSQYVVRELLLDGANQLLLSEANIEHVDTARTSKDLLVSYSRPGLDEIRVGRWSNGNYSNERVVAGLLAHFNCNDTRFIYRGYARMKRPTYKYSYATNSNSTFSTDNDIHHTDWMPTC
ncbi:MAG TPA: hypothetical protein VFU20_03100 [Sphingomicrobium sp.]|nr:hypothetical protein [Sphingomicrobium sp.]